MRCNVRWDPGSPRYVHQVHVEAVLVGLEEPADVRVVHRFQREHLLVQQSPMLLVGSCNLVGLDREDVPRVLLRPRGHLDQRGGVDLFPRDGVSGDMG